MKACLSRTRTIWAGLVAVVTALGLVGCSNSNPLDNSQGSGGGDKAIVVGSQDYYSNEIIAEIYAQALEHAGAKVDRQLRIGQREVYLPEIEKGQIDLFPEYTGPLLKYWKKDATAKQPDEVYSELSKAVPSGLRVLDQSEASDQDSYVVTREFADKWKLKTVADLAKVTDKLTMGANSEAENRPNGPKGLKQVYGVTAGFTPIEDSGGPLTVKALKNNSIQLAIIYTADPSIKNNNLVSLEDTKGLFLPSHVVPLASKNVDQAKADVINKISKAMSVQDLIELNARSVNDKLPAKTIAKDWLTSKGLV